MGKIWLVVGIITTTLYLGWLVGTTVGGMVEARAKVLDQVMKGE